MTENKNFGSEGSSSTANRENMTGKLMLIVSLLITVLLVFIFINSTITARSDGTAESTGGSFPIATSGSCCSVGALQSGGDEALARGAVEYYREGGGDITGIQALVDDFGCHQEISLMRDGELIKRYSYLDSEYIDITP